MSSGECGVCVGPVQGRGESRIVGRYCERFHLQEKRKKK